MSRTGVNIDSFCRFFRSNFLRKSSRTEPSFSPGRFLHLINLLHCSGGYLNNHLGKIFAWATYVLKCYQLCNSVSNLDEKFLIRKVVKNDS